MGELLALKPRSLVGALLGRFQFLQRAGITFGGKRDIYEVCGYARTLTPKDFRDRYDRDGIAARVIDCYPKATWREGAFLQEDDDPKKTTAFEQAWETMDARLGCWPMFQRVDTLARLSTYSVLLIGTADGKLEEELPKGNSPDQIIFLSAFCGGGSNATVGSSGEVAFVDATIAAFETDPSNPRFGLPLAYQLRRLDATSQALTRQVHWSRVIHVAEGLLDNDVFGIPQLQDVWNRFDDLDKVTGGGAEAFFQRANKGLNLNLDKDVEMQPDDAKKLNSEVEDYIHGITRILKTRAMTVQELGSDVANFSQPAEAIIAQIAGAKGIPKRILMGSEMGHLASTQDQDNWNTQVQDRRSSYAGPRIVKPFVDRLITYGYLPKPADYIIVWPDVSNLTETEKADGATKWATTNQTAGITVFTPEEIRDHWYGMDPLTDEQLKKAQAQKEAENPPPPPPVIAKPGAPGAKPATIGGGKRSPGAPGSATGSPFPRAAEAYDELVGVLEEALELGNTAVVDDLLGRTAGDRPGHPFHGNQWTGSESSHPTHPLPDKPEHGAAVYDMPGLDSGTTDTVQITKSHKGGWDLAAENWDAHTDTAEQMRTKLRGYKARYIGWETRALGDSDDSEDPQLIDLGGPGSGNFGHKGRPGKTGGSSDSKPRVKPINPGGPVPGGGVMPPEPKGTQILSEVKIDAELESYESSKTVRARSRAKDIVEDGKRMLAEYPKLGSLYGNTGFQPLPVVKLENTDHVRGTTNALGQYNPYGKGNPVISIAMNNRWHSALDGWTNSGNSWTWSTSENGGFLSTYRHELGHDVYMTRASGQHRADWWNIWNDSKRGFVTKYANTNDNEYFAESFATYTNPNYRAGQLPPLVEGYMKNLIGERVKH